jgi:hypothetical protein
MKWVTARNKDRKPDAPSPDVAKRRSHRDTRRWCRGKVGVEHVQVVRYQAAIIARGGWAATLPKGRREAFEWQVAAPPCRWSPLWKMERRRDGRWSVPIEWRWVCSHEIGCSACGKRLALMHGPDCPDYHALSERERLSAQPRKW